MFDDYSICPYTGLRSFTEEESIYFKGRDTHILQATSMLEKNKFLMLTGASGDGKSSLVYAGVIPNAKAGFLKASYSNWAIADFRPERNPFQNLCSSIGKALNIENAATVESELQHGFAALVDLYKSSVLYVDKSSADYQQASEEQQKALRHTTANLIILVDQFEEFFTNPENYVHGVPSNEAALTVNLLLETAKIALEEGIPIYVVFTMRSDFIGQCAAFRELPEYIGFSQFFVPRLNRKLLQEVIEEPCILSGNKITRRLTERIIHDISDGVDQLPILQHALNQIWKAANDGKEEMDLIHYAMVGGMEADELPDEEKEKFQQWFSDLPENIQRCYYTRSLHNVLDTHANKIFESAAAYYKEKTNKTISNNLAQEIIKTTLTSLTKIDQSREVRNRMTLEEISKILNNPEADTETIATTINVFREPGNTFIRPFILEDNPESKTLQPDTVLDITHESLIRNWGMLRTWAKEEYDKFVVFKDFKLQVDRWVQHRRSGGFLLPIGSLTFFENWYRQVRINKHWINRYNEQVTDTPKNLEESTLIFQDANEFLKRSASKHLITRAVVRFGPRKIAAVLAVFLLLGTSSFYYYDHVKKTNDYVLNQLYQDADALLNADKAGYNTKATYIINRERIDSGQFAILLNGLQTDTNKLRIAIAAAEDLVHHDRQGSIYLTKQAIKYADSIATVLYTTIPEDLKNQNSGLRDVLNLAEICEYYLYFYEDQEIADVQKNLTTLMSNITLHLLKHPFSDMDMQKLNESIELGLNHNSFTQDQINTIISTLTSSGTAIQSNYSKELRVSTDRAADSYLYNGKYQMLADIYAAQGNVQACLAAIDTLLAYHTRYEEYATDGISVAGYFALYGHWNALDNYVKAYARRLGYKPFEIYRQIANRSGYRTQAINYRFQFNGAFVPDVWYNPVLDYMADSTLDQLLFQYMASINATASSTDQRNFSKAIYFKQKGLFLSKRNQDKQLNEEIWKQEANQDFRQAVKWYNQVNTSYLNEEITAQFHLSSSMQRRQVFTFPDYIEHVPSLAARIRYSNYLSSSFLEYLIDAGLIKTIYPTASEFRQVITWIREYKNSLFPYVFDWEGNTINLSSLQKIDSALISHPSGSQMNNNMLLLLMANQLFNQNQTELALAYARRINPVALPDLFNEEFFVMHQTTLELVGEVHGNLVTHHQYDIAHQILEIFSDIRNRSRIIDKAATVLYIDGQDSLGNKYLDSANALIASITDFGRNFQNFRKIHGYAVALKGDKESFKTSNLVIRNLNDFMRNLGYSLNVRATGFTGHYFEAYSGLPKFYSSEEKLSTINEILYSQVYYEKNELWKVYDYRRDLFTMTIGFD